MQKQTWHVGNIRARCAQEGSCSASEKTAIDKLLSQQKSYAERIREVSNREIQTKDYPDRYPTNQDAIGIEIVGRDYTKATPEQLSAVRDLVEALKDRFGLSNDDVYAHGTISYKDPQEGSNLGY